MITKLPARLLAWSAGVFLAAAHGQTVPSVTTLHNFSALPSFGAANSGGAYPDAGPVQARDGNFYGTTSYGGSKGNGTFFSITPTGEFTTLYNFDASSPAPTGALIQGSDGNFYGTTASGGSEEDGTVFSITPAGRVTTLHEFDGSDGEGPYGRLIQGSDGNFYGTTYNGGSSNNGTVFSITPAGVVTTLHNFSALGFGDGNSDGAFPLAGLIQARDGNFYGTASSGGLGSGTAFSITPAGGFTVLAVFNEGNPVAPSGLTQGSDGNFYGTTQQGGEDDGTVFSITPAGRVTTLHNFDGTDGGEPDGLIQARDGNFYGAAFLYGDSNGGTLFSITPPGVLTTLHNFAGSDGLQPDSPLIQGSDGNLYGTTNSGGSNGTGTIFRVNTLPVITSATETTATAGHAFSYQITATNAATTYVATGLPAGLSVNAQTGLISGIPQAAGSFSITLVATNAFGEGSAMLALRVAAAGTPVITSALTLAVAEDAPFSYQITATGSPTRFGVQGLPSGITVNAQTGVISGSHHGVGTVTLTLDAYNAKGQGSAYLTLQIYGAPVVTSATTAAVFDGDPFSYQITARNYPTRFGVQGLPSGLTVDPQTGLISGTHKGGGTVKLTLNAYNSVGKGSATLTFSVYEQ